MENLLRLRTERNMSLTDLAKATGLSTTAINTYEKGKRCPKVDAAIKLAEALNVPLAELIGQ